LSATAGYSGKPLWQKLGLKPGVRLHVAGAPRDYRELTAADVALDFVGVDDECDLLHLFVRDRAQLEATLPHALARVAAGGACWVSWPKKSSPLFRDLTEDGIRAVALPLRWVDVKVCAVDADWSALLLRRRR
jgi:hypothetical protein